MTSFAAKLDQTSFRDQNTDRHIKHKNIRKTILCLFAASYF